MRSSHDSFSLSFLWLSVPLKSCVCTKAQISACEFVLAFNCCMRKQLYTALHNIIHVVCSGIHPLHISHVHVHHVQGRYRRLTITAPVHVAGTGLWSVPLVRIWPCLHKVWSSLLWQKRMPGWICRGPHKFTKTSLATYTNVHINFLIFFDTRAQRHVHTDIQNSN